VVIHDFDIFGARSGPTEADAVLIVDPDPVLTSAVAAQSFEPVARGHSEVEQPSRNLELPQLAPGNGLDGGEPPDSPALSEPLGLDVTERDNHDHIVTRCVIDVKRVYRDAPNLLSPDALLARPQFPQSLTEVRLVTSRVREVRVHQFATRSVPSTRRDAILR